MSETKTTSTPMVNDPYAKQEQVIRDKMNLLKKKILGLKQGTGRNSAIRESIRHAYQTFSFYQHWPYATIAIIRQMIERKGPGGFRVDYPSWKDIISYDWHDKTKIAEWKTLEELKRGRRLIFVKPKAVFNANSNPKRDEIKSRLRQKLEKLEKLKTEKKNQNEKENEKEKEKDDSDEDSDADMEEIDLHGNSNDVKSVPDLPMTQKQIKMITDLSEQVHTGKTFVIITVPTFSDVDDLIPNGIIMDLITISRTDQDDLGRIPAKLHHFYHCPVCNSNGDIGTPKCKKLIPCPDCGAIYYCSPQHLDAHRYIHTSVFPIGNCGKFDDVKARLAEDFEKNYNVDEMAKQFSKKHPELKMGKKTKEMRDFLEKTMDEIDEDYARTRAPSSATAPAHAPSSSLTTKTGQPSSTSESKDSISQIKSELKGENVTGTASLADFVAEDGVPLNFGALPSDIDFESEDVESEIEAVAEQQSQSQPPNSQASFKEDLDVVLRYAKLAIEDDKCKITKFKSKEKSKIKMDVKVDHGDPSDDNGHGNRQDAEMTIGTKQTSSSNSKNRKKQKNPGVRSKRGPYKKKGNPSS